ncbi:hypothetical protein PIB30_022635 [Stylosanthes scabra]|uniref:Uncharacterized protein n=1 Tax=Stylosanthes scabra TaxID=79078 RepID=A0ABU6T8X4_9FABA|nr:hypothetical protein [Stylosanthes scabra]
MNYYKWFVPQFSMAPDHAVHFWWDRWWAFFRLQRGYEYAIYQSWRMRSAKRLREIMHEIRNMGAPHGWIRDDLWKRHEEFWRQEDFKKLKQTNKRNWASNTGGPEPPPIDEDALWAKYAGGCKKGRIYGKGVVPSHKYPPLFADTDDDDTATGPPDVREQVVLLNRELSQQVEAHAHKVAVVEAACSKKVRSLESTVQAQSQEVSDLRKVYSDMYNYLSQIRSGSSASEMPEMPPPPPPSLPPPT